MIKPEDFTKIKHDSNGNPRYVIHFLKLVSGSERETANNMGMDFIDWQYKQALKRAKQLGGREFHNKQYGGGIVFRSVFNLNSLCYELNKLVEKDSK